MVGMDEIAEDTGRLIFVLDRLESRHDDAARMLLRLRRRKLLQTKQRKCAGRDG